MPRVVKYCTGLLIALVGALLAKALSLPLPWILGALIATALFKMGGLPSACPGLLRNAGQWVIGTSLGLYFTPHMLRVIGHNFPYIVAGMLFALLLGILGSIILHRLAGADFKTAWFSSAIGGASEMANLAERHKARVDLVASAHSLRMLMVVVSIPFAFEFLGIRGTDTSAFDTTRFFDPAGFPFQQKYIEAEQNKTKPQKPLELGIVISELLGLEFGFFDVIKCFFHEINDLCRIVSKHVSFGILRDRL